MKKKNIILWALILVACLSVLTACAAPASTPTPANATPAKGTPAAAQNLAQPQPQVTQGPTPVLVPGEVTVSDTSIVDESKDSPTKLVVIKGDLPSSCSRIQVDIKPDTDAKKIAVRIYSAHPKDEKCTETPQSYETRITLAGYTPGEYSVSVNDKEIASKVEIK